jgi:hypothetical protein
LVRTSPSRGEGRRSESCPAHHFCKIKPELHSVTSTNLLPFTSKDSIDWDLFRTWLEQRYCKKTVVDRFKYAHEFAQCLIQKDFSRLNMVSESKRQHALKGLAALSKFLGAHRCFRRSSARSISVLYPSSRLSA